MEPEKQAFLTALENNKYDGDTRKVFADWLSEHGYDAEAEFQYNWTPEWQKAHDWMTWFAKDVVTESKDIATVEQVLEVGRNFLETGEETCLSGEGFDVTNWLYDNPDGIKEYWKNWEILEKKTVPEEITYREPFKCCY